MSAGGSRTSTPRVRLTPELRRLRIQTKQDYTASGRTRLASRLADDVESPFNRSTRVVRSPTQTVTPVPVGNLLDGEEFGSPLLQVGSFEFDDQEIGTGFSEGSDSDGDDFAGDGHQTRRPGNTVEQIEVIPVEIDPLGPVLANENRDPLNDMAFNLRDVDGLVPEFDGRSEELDRFIRGVELAIRLTPAAHHPTLLEVVLVKFTGRAQVLSQEGMTYENWDALKVELKHRFKASRPTKAIRKALESLFQGPEESVRQYALKVEDTLAEYISSDAAEGTAEQRRVLTVDRQAQALDVFVDGLHGKLRDWAKARDFASLKDAVDYALSEEQNIKPKAKLAQGAPSKGAQAGAGQSNHSQGGKNANQGRGSHGTYRGKKTWYAASSGQCFSCGQTGHTKANCPQGGTGGTKQEPHPVMCGYCDRPGHNANQCYARQHAEAAKEQNASAPTFRPQHVPKNAGSSSARPANIRAVQTTNAQVHPEPQVWNEIREAPESSGNQSA